MDIEFFWNAQQFQADYKVVNSELAHDHDIKTAVIISLFTDRRAADDDLLPYANASKRGWWADALLTRRIGSRLWLLSREKQLQSVVNRAREYAKEALQWLLDDGVVKTIVVDAQNISAGVLALYVRIERNNAPPASYKFEFAWSGMNQIRN